MTREFNMKEFGKRLKARRQLLGLSQEEVARQIFLEKQDGTTSALSQPAYKYYEDGLSKKMPSREFIEQAATILKVEPEYLVGDDEIVLERFPEEIQQWLMNEKSTAWVIDAYKRYIDFSADVKK